jgi:hypothetical protein
MRAHYLLPLSYAYLSRLRDDRSFYVVVEYVPALLISLFFGSSGGLENLWRSGLSFLAFMSIYEIGYLVNDHVSVRWEAEPRRRGNLAPNNLALALWILTRLFFFALASRALDCWAHPLYWGYFNFLTLVFGCHNAIQAKELRFCTFYWLSVCRFVAPNLWVIQAGHLNSLFLASAVLYSGFRILGYLDSKDLLAMPQRRSVTFRLTYYALPLPLGLISGWSPFQLLSLYYFGLALLYWRSGRGPGAQHPSKPNSN